MYIYTYIYIYVYTYTHTYIHMQYSPIVSEACGGRGDRHEQAQLPPKHIISITIIIVIRVISV